VAVVAAMRPRQWLKNALVFAAPLAAGDIFKPAVLVPSLLAFVAFCLISSSTYVINDLRDAEADRAHPTKRSRPIAAGELSVTLAVILAVVLAVAALALAFSVNVGLLAVLVCYFVFTTSYSLWLKNEPVIELVLLAMGFLIRAIAGGVASDLPISQWFLIVAGFGSLFMAAGKRYSELNRTTDAQRTDGAEAVATRRSMAGYTLSYLRFVWATAAAVTVTAYCLWAFEVGTSPASAPWAAWSVLPFVVGLLRFGVDVDRGEAEAPEDVVVHDLVLVATGVVWLVLFTLGSVGA
jgi:decaprenyl-phosphate phosphoribosyltransferase